MTRGIWRRAEDADQLANDIPRNLPNQSHLILLSAHHAINRELKEPDIPHSTCVELKSTQCESGKLVAERLNEVAAEDEVKGENLGTPRIEDTGEILWKKNAHIEAPLPSDTESMRLHINMTRTI